MPVSTKFHFFAFFHNRNLGSPWQMTTFVESATWLRTTIQIGNYSSK